MRNLLYLLAALSLFQIGCGLDSGNKNACNGPVDCLSGYLCNAANQTCELPAVGPDGCERAFCQTGQCGEQPDGCGGLVDCGSCDLDPTECEPENDLVWCQRAEASCGSVDIVDSCGSRRTVGCGTCSDGHTCGVFISGDCNTMVCTDDGWCRPTGKALLSSYQVRDLWTDASGTTWAAAEKTNGSDGRIVVHDGTNWRHFTDSNHEFRAVHGLGGAGDRVWFVGEEGEVLRDWNETVAEANSEQRTLTSIVAIGVADVWAVGYSTSNPALGVVTHFDGTVWTEGTLGTFSDGGRVLTDVTATSSDAVWAVGLAPDGPLIAQFDGLNWSMDLSAPGGEYLRAIWAAGPNDLWAVGDAGTILHYNGFSWSESNSGVNQDLFAITGSGGSIWAAGEDGVVLKRVGSSWVVQDTGTSRTIHALHAKSATDVWAGGSEGLLIHYEL